MRRFLIGLFLSSVVHLVYGQTSSPDSTIVAKDSIVRQPQTAKKAPPKYSYGVFIESAARITPAFDHYRLTTSHGIGGQFEFISAGFNAYQMQSNVYATLVFPNRFSMHSRHGAVYVGLRVFKSRFVHGEMKCNFGKGDVVWRRTSNNEDFVRDEFNLLEPEIVITAVPVKYAKLYLCAGYRRISDLNIAKVTNQDLSGFTLGLGVKVGIYN